VVEMGTQQNAAPVIIKRKKVVAGGGHHGGAWKVAIGLFLLTCRTLLRPLMMPPSEERPSAY